MAENFIRIKQINQSELSGYISSIVATGINVTSTALATGENIVYTTGDQTISGNKTFVNNFSITGSATIANISNGATLQLSGNRVLTTADSITATATGLPDTLLYTSGFQIISGSKTLTGVGVVLNVTTGATLQLSGNRVLTTADTITATATGLPDTIVYQSGDQTISGAKTFVGRLIAGTGFFGLNNRISGLWAGIGAGSGNFASGDYSFIGGGFLNCATAGYSNVGGGRCNCATVIYSTVGGGFLNCATACYSTIGGGYSNRTTACWSTVGGGRCNCAAAGYSNVGGGLQNCATGYFSTVGGGYSNRALGCFSTVGGGRTNCATAGYSNVGGGLQNCATAIYSTVGGGNYNCAAGRYSIVGGGERNCALGNYSYIIGGRCAVIQTTHSGAAVLGDGQNRAHNSFSEHSLSLDFASGVYFNNQKIFGFVPEIVNISDNFLISGNFNSDVILATNSNQITGTLISGNPTGFNLSIIQGGAGQIQITGSGSNVMVSSFNNQFRTAGQFAQISVIHTGNNRYIMYGNTIA